MIADFSSETIAARKKWQDMSNAGEKKKKKELSTQKLRYNQNILQESKGKQDLLRCRKPKRTCHQQPYPKRMSKGHS